MAVLNNTGILMGSSAVTAAGGDEGYQIKKSLRLDGYPGRQTPGRHWNKVNGNPRIWTFATWFKMSINEPAHPYWFAMQDSGSSKYFLGRITNSNSANLEAKLNIYWYDGTTTEQIDSAQKTRDSSGWSHLIYAVNTDEATAADRYKMYLNGTQLTSFTLSNGGYPDRFEGLVCNIADGKFDLFNWGDSSTFNGNVADTYYIDGLALPPEAFGKFDADNIWQPIEFHKPSPNAGVTWSGLWSVNTGSFDQAITLAHNGTIASGGSAARSSANSAIATMDLSSNKIDVKSSIEIYGNTTSPGYSHQFWVTVDGTEYTFVAPKGRHKFNVSGELTQIKVQNDHPDGRTNIEAVLVDGILLIDGRTDTNWDTWSTEDKVNIGETHSSEVTSETGSFYGANVVTKLFDGNTQVGGGIPTNVDASSSGKWVKWTPADPIAFNTKVEVSVASNSNTISLKRVGVGSTDDITTSGSPAWHTVYTGSGQIEYIQNQAVSGGYNNWEAIRVDGVVLTDYKQNANSFHCKYLDTSSNKAISRDYLNGKIDKCTGGLPIYKTKAGSADNDTDYGLTKDTGYRADSSAGTTDGTGLVYALPGDVLDGDVHQLINTGSSKKTTDTNGNPYVDTVDFQFYGSSINFDGNGDYLDIDGGTDFNFGTGDYTIECWFRTTDNSRNQGIFQLTNTANGLGTDQSSHINCFMDNSGFKAQLGDGGGAKTILSGTKKPQNDQWYHIAYVRKSGIFKVYLDGVCHLVSADTTNHADQYLAIGGYYSISYLFLGNIQDFRVYKGVAKYSAGFTAPARNDLTNIGLQATNPGTSSFDYLSTGGSKEWKTLYGSGVVGTVSADDDYGGVIEWIKCDSTHARATQNYQNWYGVRIDGTHLNESGTEYSEDLTSSTGSYYGSNTAPKLFDGDESTNVDASGGGGWVKWTPDGGHKFRAKIEVLHHPGGETQVFTVKLKSKPEAIDVFVDSPVNSGTDTGAGGEITGNYCTLQSEATNNNPSLGLQLHQAGLAILRSRGTIDDTSCISYGSFLLPKTGKWYWEVRVPANNTAGGNTYAGITCHELTTGMATHIGAGYGTQLVQDASKTVWTTGSTSSVDMGAWVMGDWIGFAFDGAAQTLKVYKGGALKHTWSSIAMTNRSWRPAISQSAYGSTYGTISVNFGQFPFANNAPADHKCLCTQNLSDIVTDDNKASSGFEIVRYDGQSRDWEIKGVGFKPGLAIIKETSDDQSWQIYDVTRGTANNYKRFEWNTLLDQETKTDGVKTFNSDGLSIGGNAAIAESDKEYSAFLFNAGASAATASTEGDITPTAQWVNKDYGFSITQWTGGGGTKTIGHGLDKAPVFFISRNVDTTVGATLDTFVYHHGIGATAQVRMNEPDAKSVDWFNDTAPDADVFTMGDTSAGNENGAPMITYCWHEVAGFSAFGYYEGNDEASHNAHHINLGFKPGLLIIKNADASADWLVYDLGSRISGNPHETWLETNTDDDLETSANNAIDITANGFKIRNDTIGSNDANTYIYAAWAESPFKTARANL